MSLKSFTDDQGMSPKCQITPDLLRSGMDVDLPNDKRSLGAQLRYHGSHRAIFLSARSMTIRFLIGILAIGAVRTT
jgi:hypothetical protein